MKPFFGKVKALFKGIRPRPVVGDALPHIVLPAPGCCGGRPIMDAFSLRRTTRDFAPTELPEVLLSDLLWAANGVKPQGRYLSEGRGRSTSTLLEPLYAVTSAIASCQYRRRVAMHRDAGIRRVGAGRACRSAALHVLPYRRLALSCAAVSADRGALSERSERSIDTRNKIAARGPAHWRNMAIPAASDRGSPLSREDAHARAMGVE